MVFRLISTTLPLRTATRTASFASSRCSKSPSVEHVNRNTISIATLDDSKIELAAKMVSSKSASSSLSWPVGVFANVNEEGRKLNELCQMPVLGEMQDRIARTWDLVEEEPWLERFGGPGKTMENVAGHGTVVLRDSGPGGKAYLRVLI